MRSKTKWSVFIKNEQAATERGCIFLTSDVDWHTNNVLEAFRIAKKFVEDYRKADKEGEQQ